MIQQSKHSNPSIRQIEQGSDGSKATLVDRALGIDLFS